jgi:hypothetical protein
MKIFILGIFYLLICIFLYFINKKHNYLISKEILALEKVNLNIIYTNIDFAKKYFDVSKIQDAKKGRRYKGIYHALFDIVKIKDLNKKATYESIKTILHEYKHKKDRFNLVIAEILTYIILLNSILGLLKVYKFHIILIILCTVYSFLVKTIAENRAMSYSYKKVIKILDFNLEKELMNEIVFYRAIIDGSGFLIAYSFLSMIPYLLG